MVDQNLQDIRRTLHAALEPVTEIEIVYLFGSAATGALKKDSDLDLALGFVQPEDPLGRVRFLGQMEDLLGDRVERVVDLIDLYRASPILLHQILKSGRPALLVRDERKLLEFEVRARRLYFERKRRYAIYDAQVFR